MKQLEYIKKVLEFQKTTETTAMYNIVPYPFSNNEYYLNDFDINQCSEILKYIEIVEKFSDKIKNATICFTKRHDGTETLLLCVRRDLKYHKAIDGYFHNVFKEANGAFENEFINNITFDESKSFHLSVLKNYILELSFENFNKMANYLFNHKLLKFDNDMFTDPKTIKFQFVCWEQIIQFDFDNWLQIAKGFQRFAGDSYDGYLTMNNMYDFAKWYNENKQLQEKNNNEFKEKELKRVGLINEVVQPESDFDTNDKTNPLIFDYQLIVDLHRDFSNYLWNTIDIDNFKNCFRKAPKKLEFHKNITLPEICYFFGKIEYKETVVKPFSDWMVYHIGKNNYIKNRDVFKQYENDARALRDSRNNYSLTVPQKKALENKQKIDTLFNRILSN